VWQGGGWVKTNELHIVYDGRLPIQERDSNNVPLVTYTRGLDLSGSLQGAGGIGGLLARQSTISNELATVFYHSDAVGNVTALMDTQENIVGRYLYSPFGKLTRMTGPMASANVMQFSSKPRYRGLDDFGLRWLYSDIGGFLSNDPIQERGGTPLRGFVRNNPLRYIDSFGLQGLSITVPEQFPIDPYIPGANVQLNDTIINDTTIESGDPLSRQPVSGNRVADALTAQALLLNDINENMDRLGLSPEAGHTDSGHPQNSKKPCPPNNSKSNSPVAPIIIPPNALWSMSQFTNRPRLNLPQYTPPAPAPPGPINNYANAPVVLPTTQPPPQSSGPNWDFFPNWESHLMGN
jgi:RHS repeat-associated protein